MSETNNPNILRTKAGKLAAVGTFLAGLGLVLHGHGQAPEKPEPTGVVEVQPGQTYSDIANKIAENNSSPDSMEHEATVLHELNPELGPQPELVAGQKINVPASADVNPQQPGVQLETPAENTELPQPVVPEENGFNPNTPR